MCFEKSSEFVQSYIDVVRRAEYKRTQNTNEPKNNTNETKNNTNEPKMILHDEPKIQKRTQNTKNEPKIQKRTQKKIQTNQTSI